MVFLLLQKTGTIVTPYAPNTAQHLSSNRWPEGSESFVSARDTFGGRERGNALNAQSRACIPHKVVSDAQHPHELADF